MSMHHDNPHLVRAQLLLSQRRYDLAEEQFRQAIGADPNEAIAYSGLAFCLAEREAWGEATEAARRAMGLAPGDARMHYTFASVMRDRNMLNEARGAIEVALGLDPGDPDSWALLASIDLAEKRWRAVLEATERGLECDAEHEGCINLRAIALTNLGDRSGAAAAIDATLQRNPENAVTHANLGWTRLHESRPRDAMTHFREALRLDPEMEWARAGIVEAMKARSFIYRIFLAYFLMMSRLRGRAQWMVVIGAYIGFRAIWSISEKNPSLSPWLTPLIVVYLIFALGTMISVPLFNLFLLSSRFGRHALSEEQRKRARIFGLSLLPAFAFLALWATVPHPGMEFGAITCGVWVIPVALATQARPGRQTMIMGAIAGVLALVCAWFCVSVFVYEQVPPGGAITAYAFACIGSSWIANIVSAFRPGAKR